MPTSLTKSDLQKALSGLATKRDLDGTRKDLDKKISDAVKNLPTKMDVNNMIDENFADFRLALNKDLEKFATREDVEEIVGKFDDSYSEHLSKHHSIKFSSTI